MSGLGLNTEETFHQSRSLAGLGFRRLGLNPASGVGAASYASFPAPAGYRWDFVTYGGQRVTRNAVPVVALVGS